MPTDTSNLPPYCRQCTGIPEDLLEDGRCSKESSCLHAMRQKAIASGEIKTREYVLWEYDVWGNDEDGYTVNDRREVCKISIQIPITPFDINRALAEAGLWETATLSNLIDCEINGEDEPIELVYEITEQPVGQLVPVVSS